MDSNPDIAKIKRNVATMVQKGAPESDIDAYISQSGTTIDAVKNFKPENNPKELQPVGRGQLPIPGSQQTPLTQENLLDAAMMIPAGTAEAVTAKGIEAMGLPKAVQTILGGSAGGAAFNAGTGRDPVTGAVIGGGLGAGGALVGALGKEKPAIPTAAGTKAEASSMYDALQESKSTLTPTWTDKFLAKTQQFNPQTEAGKIFIGDNDITELVTRAQKLKGKPISLQAAQEIDEELSNQVSKHYGPTGLDKQGQKILDFQSEFRESMHPDNLKPEDVEGGKEGFEQWKAAQAKWSEAAKMRDIEKIMTRAGQSDNPATAMKTGFRTLYNNEKRMRAFTKEEKALIKDAAEGHFTDNFMRVFASRLRPIMASAGGGAAGTAGAYVTSNLARDAAEKLQFNRAMKVINEIAKPKAKPSIGENKNPIGDIEQYYKDNPESASRRWQ